MDLILNRPLVFFDLETTGVNISNDRIVELSLVKQFPNGNIDSCTYRVNPEMHIPESASEVHHIYDSDVAQCPTFKQLAPEIISYIEGCDLAGYNSNHFDLPVLQEELLRAGIHNDLRAEHKFIDAFVIFQKHTPRTLTAAYKHYCGKELEGAHGANADTLATREVLLAQLRVHNDVPQTVDELEKYTTLNRTADLAGRLVYDDNGEIIFNFGKYKGSVVKEVFDSDPSYYSWMMNGDFPAYTKQVISRIKNNRTESASNRAKTDCQQLNSSQPPTEDMLQQLAAMYSKKKATKKGEKNQLSLF